MSKYYFILNSYKTDRLMLNLYNKLELSLKTKNIFNKIIKYARNKGKFLV